MMFMSSHLATCAITWRALIAGAVRVMMRIVPAYGCIIRSTSVRSTKPGTYSLNEPAVIAMPKTEGLTSRQQRFVAEMLIDGNITRSALAAGFSKKTAARYGSELMTLPHIRAAVEEARGKIMNKLDLTAERVLGEIVKMAFFDPRKLFDDSGAPIHVSKLDDDTAASIAGLDVVTQGNADVGFAQVLKVKLTDKSKNLELLGKHLKLFTDKVEHSGEVDLKGMSDAELDARINRLAGGQG